MGHHASFQPQLTDDGFEALKSGVLVQARGMTSAQILDLADNLHELIRTRQAIERSAARRQALRPD